ncbi:type IV secretion-system coupling DNA-binding domain protein [Orientia tsutsugamushi str. Gilliam]|uniref:Type IV secretion-system coupling DNA-binding domain protein n=1 Tax=Orientia tsutsugamushi str. Gilliam TaxID=1359184 RepID=A0A0F3M6H5_ORITS|nr:type IV secretion system DNA-binding domain-containing protein [Orientia tsutsugamushi]KJV51355.1 type IV secretion-system coupling DNA-binding domain protein [Orientia tsutsugamushi str. Gilliam]
MQNIHQLEAIYGSAECASMLDLFNSKFIFRVSDQVTAYKSALTLGEQEIILKLKRTCHMDQILCEMG